MLAIRLQRTGRRGHAQFRLVAQDSRFSPTSGRVVAFLGSYDPHSKAVSIDKEAAVEFLKNGAQPSPRAASLLKREGVKLPDWVAEPAKKKGELRNPEKLRRNRPAEEKVEKPAEAVATDDTAATEEATEAEPAAEEKAEEPAEAAASEEPAKEEAPAAEPESTEAASEEQPTPESEPEA